MNSYYDTINNIAIGNVRHGSRYRDDSHRLPTLSLGLSSVKLIVSKLEAECRRAHDGDGPANCELVRYDPSIEHDFPLESPRGQVWYRFAVNLALALSKCIPSVTIGNFGLLALLSGFFAPRMISYLLIYPFCRLVFGTLYPAYASYKAVRTKNLKEYVKWMMYWIVFALFTCTETFTDVFLSWFPFYYEVKIVLVLWLLSPATKGSSILYRKFVHPALCRREQEIDEYIAKAKDQGYHTVLNLGTKGVNYATTVIMQTAIKGGGGLVQQIRKSYSLSDLTECDPREERGVDEADDVLAEPRLVRRAVKSSYNTRRSASETNSRTPMYFPEVDVDVRATRAKGEHPDLSHIKSSEDISSGYSSADNSTSLARSSSVRARARTAVTAIKRPLAAEGSQVIIEELHDDDFEYSHMPPLVNVPSPLFLSHSDPPFIYQYVGDQIKIVQILGNNSNITYDNQSLSHEVGQIVNDLNITEIKDAPPTKYNNNRYHEDKLEANKDSCDADDTTLTLKDCVDIVSSEKQVNLVDVNPDEKNINDQIKANSVNELQSKDTILSQTESKECISSLSTKQLTNNELKTDENVHVAEQNKLDADRQSPRNEPDLINTEDITKSHSEAIHSQLETPIDAVDIKSDENVAAKLEDIVVFVNTETAAISTENDVFIECEDEPTVNQEVIDNTSIKDDKIETASLSTSNYDNESAMSDDEASFGTPEDSPKIKRRSPKGKYGKAKAPSPPTVDKTNMGLLDVIKETTSLNKGLDKENISTTSQESIPELIVKSPNITTQNEHNTKSSHTNSISDKKRRHKAKSISKGNNLSKLLQLPSKFAFWHKSDDKSKSDAKSVSDDDSRRSSTAEKTFEEFQSCSTINTIDQAKASGDTPKSEFNQYYRDTAITDSEVISHDILEKSDALQRLIEAKLESHPEYKIVSLHEEIPTTSKSTDV